MMSFSDYTSGELVVLFGTLALLGILLGEVFNLNRLFLFTSSNCNYGYGPINGPETWKEKFPGSTGERQSPVNLTSSYVIAIPRETLTPLKFSAEHNILPQDIRLYNDGSSVTIYARWDNDARPLISGGPFADTYQFYNARFHWGPTDEEGSEHTIDSIRFAMELQVTYIKVGETYEDLKSAAESNGILTICYFYQVTPVDNPFLEPIIKALKHVTCPFTRYCMEPMPLSSLMPAFTSRYYVYEGSLTHPPCIEGVKWIVQPIPLCVSSRQVRQFRKLMSPYGHIEMNTRPVQDIGVRDVFYYD